MGEDSQSRGKPLAYMPASMESQRALFCFCILRQYKDRFRDLVQNLKDPRNPELRERVSTGSLPAAELVRLTAKVLQLLLIKFKYILELWCLP